MTKLERLQISAYAELGTPKRGFRYKPASGRLSNEDLKRIDDLKIPPAWTDVFIIQRQKERVQAIGKDAAGRWQYLYHESHTRAQELRKFQRITNSRRRFRRCAPPSRVTYANRA
jgi:DNA topoisomerase-1